MNKCVPFMNECLVSSKSFCDAIHFIMVINLNCLFLFAPELVKVTIFSCGIYFNI